MVRSLVLSLCVVVGCGGKVPATPEPPEPEPEHEPASESGSDAECNDLSAGSEWPCGFEPDDVDCTDGPAATTFEAVGSGDGLWINACAWDAAGPAQVVTMDGRILDGTAEIDSELDASYTIEAKRFHPPSTDGVIALVIVPAIKGARIVELSGNELAVMNVGIKESYRLPEDASIALPSPIVAVDTDGDRHADAAVVHGCYRTKGDQCIETAELFVRRVNAGWVVPYASAQ